MHLRSAVTRLRGALRRDLLLPESTGEPGGPGSELPLTDWVADPVSAQSLALHVEDKVVLITGGSSGIGLETAKRVAAAGAETIICGRDRERLAEAERTIAVGGARLTTHAVDLADLAATDALVDAVLARHGRVDVLINNAGRSIRRTVEHSLGRFHDFQRTMQLNYFGALRLTLGLLPAMVQQGTGHVINVSSIGVQMGSPRFSAYAASKAAFDAWTRCAASEYADLGVAFTTLYMPLVRTPMIAPTESYERVPALSPEQAANLVLRAIVLRPASIATPIGIAVDVAHALAPEWVQSFNNYLFRSAQ